MNSEMRTVSPAAKQSQSALNLEGKGSTSTQGAKEDDEEEGLSCGVCLTSINGTLQVWIVSGFLC